MLISRTAQDRLAGTWSAMTSSLHRRTAATAVAGAALLVAAGGAVSANAQPSHSPAATHLVAKAAPSSAAQQRSVPKVVREWAAGWNTADAGRVADQFTAGAKYQDFALGYVFTGRKGVVGFVQESLKNVDDLKVKVTDAFGAGKRIGFRFTFSGHIKGAPRPFKVPVATILELSSGGKITYEGDFYNRLEVLRQSGLPTS